jgi:4-hydroxy-3-polyprenylbenzoate decarboxylase
MNYCFKDTFIPNMTKEVKKIIISITGASGAIYGIRLLEILKEYDIETHLIISKSANLSIATETSLSIKEIKNLADYVYNPSDIGAKISSGSFKVMGMIIAPCSMKTLSAIASGFENDLTIRAAGIIIKEQKKLVLMTRETPLSPIHLENMLKLSRIGVAICPPVPAFYNKPTTLDDIVNHSITRVLDLFDIETNLIKRWQGI